MPESHSSKPLRRAAWAFAAASRIATLAILGCAILMLAVGFRGALIMYWRICFVWCALALGVLVLGHVMLAWNSPGYGLDGSHFFTYLFRLLALCGFVSVAFGFTGRSRVVALARFAMATAACVLLTPLFHYRLLDSIRRGIWR